MSTSPPNSSENSRLLDNDFMISPPYGGSENDTPSRSPLRPSSERRLPASSAERAAMRVGEPPDWRPISGSVVLAASIVGLATYLTGGVLVFTLTAGMNILDALYFCIVTLTTVGYGDLSAHQPTTKVFACFYIMVGVVMFGALLATLVEMLLEHQEQIWLSMMTKMESRDKQGAERGGGHRRREEMSKSARDANIQHLRVKLWAGVLWFFILMGSGTVLFVNLERLSVVDAVYLTVVSVSTVGYGDYYPSTTGTKVFAIFFLPLTTLLLAKIVSDYTSMQVTLNTEARQRRILYQAISMQEFREMDTDGDGAVDRMEYLCRTLIAQEKLKQEDIDEVMARFDELDDDRSGKINEEEILTQENYSGDIESARVVP